MLYWTVGFLAVDMALMAGVLYILFHRKNTLVPELAEGAESSFSGASYELMGKIRDELDTAKKITTELDRKRRSLDTYERSLDEKRRELDGIIKSVKEPAMARSGELPRKRQADDVYHKAMKMINKGAPVDEVTDMLGLLNGEAELIRAVNSYKS